MPKKTEHNNINEGITLTGALLGIVIWLHIAGALGADNPYSGELFINSLTYAISASVIFLIFTLFFNGGLSALYKASRDEENQNIPILKVAFDVSLHAMAYTNAVAFSFLLTTILHHLVFNFKPNYYWQASALNTIIFIVVYLTARDFNLRQIIQHPLRTIFALVCAVIVFRFAFFNIWQLHPN